ncbi:MAG: hypothetical protein ACLFWL_03125 [Candidatus Brocadiia bacterium]
MDPDRAEVYRHRKEFIGDDGFILGLTAYPDTTMDQTRRVLDICRGFQSL